MHSKATGERHVQARIRVKSERRAEATKVLFEAMMASRQEPGNLYYYITTDLDDPDVFHFLDGWQTAEDFDQHINNERVKQTVAALETMLDGAISMSFGKLIEVH